MTPLRDAGAPRSNLITNTLANYGGTALAFLYGVFLTPFIIRTLGNALYGTWTVVASIAGYLSLFDLGLASALSKYAAEYESRGQTDVVDQLTSTLMLSFCVIGFVSMGIIVGLAPWLSVFFGIPLENRNVANVALALSGLNFVLFLVFNIYNALAVGFRRFDIPNLARAISLLISSLLTVGALMMGGDLVALAVIACVSTSAQIIVAWFLLTRWVRPVRLRLKYVRKPLLKLLLSYSAFIFVMMACNRIEQSSRPLLVARLINIEAVSYYAVGEKLSSLVRQATFPVAGIFFPYFAALSARNASDEYGRLLVTGMRFSTLIALPISVITAILARPLIASWIGPEYIASGTTAVILIGQAFIAQQLVAASSLLNGIGKLTLYTGLHIFALVFSVGLGIWFTPLLGISGVALSSLIAWSCVLIVTLIYTSRLSALHVWSLIKAAWLRPVLAIIAVGFGLIALSHNRPPQGLWQVGLQGALALLSYVLIAWFWCLEPAEQRKIIGVLAKRRWQMQSRTEPTDLEAKS